MKTFIRDEGKVTNCISNIAHMNPFEYVYYNIKYWHFYGRVLDATKELFVELATAIGHLLVWIFYILSSTILLPLLLIPAYFDIRRNKKLYKRYTQGT